MEKTLRCTVCVWRGTWNDAAGARLVRPTPLPPALEQIQAAYEEKQQVEAQLSSHPPPPRCPECGHHTLVVHFSHKQAVV